LIFGQIIKIVATGCQIVWLKCTKFDFGLGSAPKPARGKCYPDPLAGLRLSEAGGRVKGGGDKGHRKGERLCSSKNSL